MIIVKIFGGLGNQLFQYAAARKLSYIYNLPLKLDISYFEKFDLRKYELCNFNIKEDFASNSDLKHYNIARIPVLRKLMKTFKCNYFNFNNYIYYVQKDLMFDQNINNLSINNLYIDGYWQNEKYFIDIKKLIKKEFTFRQEPDYYNKSMISKIVSANSVSIHIRRGDYISNKNANKLYNVCSLEYYYCAIKEIEKYVTNPHFFVFSDDLDWVKKSLVLKYPTTYTENYMGKKDYEDLRLMSFCKHHIIANSSFSWWGAWLAEHNGKIIIAPQKWFTNDKLKYNIVPESWIKL